MRNQFSAFVKQALTTSSGTYWGQWDGLAINSKISEVETFLGEGDQVAGFVVALTVVYRTPEGNPFQVVG